MLRFIMMRIIHILSNTLICFSLFIAMPVQAYEHNESGLTEIGLSYGTGIDVSKWVQVDAITSFNLPWGIADAFPLSTYLDIGLAASEWQNTRHLAYHVSTTAMLRTQNITTPIGRIFFEAGFGPHLISKPGKTERLGTAFEFNSHLGIGFLLSKNWLMILRARHLSNGGVSSPNAGVNLYLWQLHYRFDH